MYVPRPWLKKGNNEVIVLDYNGCSKNSFSGMELPILYALDPSLVIAKYKKENQKLLVNVMTPVFKEQAKSSIEWQQVKLKIQRDVIFALRR